MILIKRYGFPLLLSLALYTAVYFLFGNGSPYLGIALALSVILSYVIRICDDIGDYEKDRAQGQAPIRKSILVVMMVAALSVFGILTLVAKAYIMLISPTVILLQFLIKDKYRDIIKPLFLPAIVVALVLSFFTPNFWLFVTVPILIISDVILIVFKRRRRDL